MKYVNDATYEILAELYGIIIPNNIENRIKYIKNELIYLNNILNRGNVTKFNLYKIKSIKDFLKIYKIYTIEEILIGTYPIKIYTWFNKKNLVFKIWNTYEYIKSITSKLSFFMERLSYYYEREYEWQNILYNHHILKQSIGSKKQKFNFISHIEYKPIIKLSDFNDRLEYHPSSDIVKSTIHWGQRKLLISELIFMIKYSNLSKYIVYIGASTGTHIKILAEIWKDHEFHLYDPAPFHKSLKKYENIIIYQQLFTINDSEKWVNKDVLFISDIRSGNLTTDTMESVEKNVLFDMKLQKDICDKIKPKMASFKFRLPYSEGHTEYYDGTIFLQAWATNSGTETRLFTNCKNLKYYDHKEYEEKMYYHNKINRIKVFPFFSKNNPVKKGYDHCFDCQMELIVLNLLIEYIKKNNINYITDISKLSQHISDSIFKGRDLYSGNVDKEKRIQGILETHKNVKFCECIF